MTREEAERLALICCARAHELGLNPQPWQYDYLVAANMAERPS